MDSSKKEFEKQLNFFSKAGLWYALPFTLVLTGLLGYMAFSMGNIFNFTQLTLIALVVIMIILDCVIVINIKNNTKY